MNIITLPTALKIKEFVNGVVDYQLTESSDATGASKDRIIGPSRWSLHIVSNSDMDLAEASRWEALILSLRGAAVLAAYDIVRQLPRGTMRGSPVLAATLNVGDTTAQITGSGSLETGDWLQFGTGYGTSQRVKVMAPTSAISGTITVQFSNPIRKAIAAGSTVTWYRPVSYFRRTNLSGSLGTYTVNIGAQGDFALDLLERF